MYQPRMYGDFAQAGGPTVRAGFMHSAIPPGGFDLSGPAVPAFTRGSGLSEKTNELIERMQRMADLTGATAPVEGATIQRIDVTGDMPTILSQLGMALAEFKRAVTTGMTAFPVRENLEAEAKLLVPLDTPVRNMLPRVPGAGLATQWRQLTSLGGGYGVSGSATLDQPGSTSFIRTFFAESGSPAEHTETYVNKSLPYKLLGTLGSITGFAQSAGANFQNQRSVAVTNSIRNLMLNEELSLIAGDSTSAVAPWGDGITPLAFDGLINLITVANGTPAAQVQTAVGGLTLRHVDAQLTRLWIQGAQGPWILANGQEVQSFVHLAEASGSIIRVQATATADTILGVAVTGYKHPVTGEVVPIVPSRFLPAGTLLFLSKFLPDGTPTFDVDVLPQVALPQLAPDQQVQGFTYQELAPTAQAAQVYPQQSGGSARRRADGNWVN